MILFRAVQTHRRIASAIEYGAIIADIFPKNERGSAFGYNSLGWTAGAMIGIVLVGVITTFFGWEYIFFINIPIGIAAVILGVIHLKDAVRVKTSLDLGGIGLIACSLTLLSFDGVDFASQGLTHFSLASMIIGGIMIPIFVSHERRSQNPMLDLSVFSDRALKYSILNTGKISVAQFVESVISPVHQGSDSVISHPCVCPQSTPLHFTAVVASIQRIRSCIVKSQDQHD